MRMIQAGDDPHAILIVSSSSTTVQDLETMLTAHDYVVWAAYDGTDALALATRYALDIVVLDTTLPDMSGFALCRRLHTHEKNRSLPIVFVSASHALTDKVQAFQAGAADYITRPFQGEEVLARLAHHLALKRQQDDLRRSTESFRLLAENARDMIFRYRFTPPRGFEYVSPAVESIMGYTPEEYYDDPDIDLKCIHPDSRAIFAIMGQSPDASKEQITLRYIRKDGSDVWVEQTHTPILDETGRTIAVEGIARDITERKQAEDALVNNLQFLETLLNAIANPVFYKDNQGRYRGYNRLFARQILGLPDEHIPEHFFYEQAMRKRHTLVVPTEELDMQLMSGSDEPAYISRVWCADGIWRDFCFSRATFVDAEGRDAGLVYVMLDMTERIAQEAELRATYQDLKYLNDRLQQELDMARRTQQSLLPAPIPAWNGPDVVCYNMPAREVGGDLYIYDILEPPTSTTANGTYVIAVGDVSGKGMPAALLMAVSIATFRSLVGRKVRPSAALAYLDSAIANHTRTTLLNCALVYVEITTSGTPDIAGECTQSPRNHQHHMVRVANAGCVAPLILRLDNTIEWVEVGGIPLGLDTGLEVGYEEVNIALQSGEMLLLVSDGVLEAKNASGAMFSFERLERVVRSGPRSSAQAMLTHLRLAIETFTGETEPHDDLTIVVTRIG